MKEKVFNIKLTGKTIMLFVGGVAIAVTSYLGGRWSAKKGCSKEELHKMAEAPTPEERPQAPAAAAPQA